MNIKEKLLTIVVFFIVSTVFVSTSEVCATYVEYNSEIEYEEREDGVAVRAKDTSIVSVIIPNQIKGKKVKVVGGFENCTQLNNIEFQTPSYVELIENTAFKNCTSLEKINLPDTLKKIEYAAFYNCRNLKKLSFPESLTELEGGYDNSTATLGNCDKLESITFTKAIKNIGAEYIFNDVKPASMLICGYEGSCVEEWADSVNFRFLRCVPVESIQINGIPTVIEKMTQHIEARISPMNAHNLNVTWESSNPDVVEIDENGFVTAKKIGTAIITARAKDGTGVKTSMTMNIVTSNPFDDVGDDDWFNSTVRYVYSRGMVLGTTKTTFSPYQSLTRGMLVTILWRMEGIPECRTGKFSDVPSSEWFFQPINWAASKGIVYGYNDGTGNFGPYDIITREQLAVILSNYAKYKNKSTSESKSLTDYKDCEQVSEWAKSSLSWAVAKGILNGKDNKTRLDPLGHATRAEAAAMLMNFCKNLDV